MRNINSSKREKEKENLKREEEDRRKNDEEKKEAKSLLKTGSEKWIEKTYERRCTLK